METREQQSLNERQRVAMEKVINPYQEPFLPWHTTSETHLRSVLERGLLSGNEAKRLNNSLAKRIFRRKFNYNSSSGAPYNEQYISVAKNLDVLKIPTQEVGIILDPTKIQMVDPKTIEHGIPIGDRLYPKEFEAWVKGRIPPDAFLGLIVGEKPSFYPVGSRFYEDPPSDPNKIIRIVKSLKAKSALPIYFKGELIWPMHMNQNELQNLSTNPRK